VRRLLLLLLVLPLLLALPAAAEEELGDPLPDPDAYRSAGPTCQNRVKMSPWVGMPAVNFPETSRCVLVIHTCKGPERSESNVRKDETGMCADYEKVEKALASREICCDKGAPEQPKSEPKKEPKRDKKYTDCSEEMQKKIEAAVYDAGLALEFSGCMERNGESFAKWNERLGNLRFVCWEAITNQDNPPCAKAGRPRETAKKFSRNTITVFSRNIDSCGCLHANIIHELAHGFDYGHEPPRNAYDLEFDCAACGK
jgi:hypothetical protein